MPTPALAFALTNGAPTLAFTSALAFALTATLPYTRFALAGATP